jgi:Ca-activated chloride channel family protein
VIGFPDGLSDSNGMFHESVRGKAVKLMNELADESGGRAFFPECLYDVTALTEKIGNDLHSQYTIGYFSSNDKQDGSWRTVQIRLDDAKKKEKDLAVRTRRGYFAHHEN